MRNTARKQFLALVLVLAMLAGLSVPALAAEEGGKTVTILQTSDLHGMVNPFDYASNKENKTSMAHAAAIIRRSGRRTRTCSCWTPATPPRPTTSRPSWTRSPIP